jgi:hypothetical protein
MVKTLRVSHWLVGMVVLTMVECAAIAAIGLAVATPAQAQFSDNRYRHQHRSGGFFQQLFGPFNPPRYERDDEPSRSAPQQQQQHVDHSRAPSGPKAEKDATPTATIVVMGDGMSDWLGYGLEDAFSDDPGVAVVRKDKQKSGLIHYDVKGDLDWWHAVRDILTKEKANYVVMMVGLNDRDSIREKDVAKDDEKQKAEKEQAKNAANKAAQKKDPAKDPAKPGADDKKQDQDQESIATAEQKPASNGIIDFRSDAWAKVYSRRIDETINALKSKGVPVFWVGLPAIRGTKSTADAVYLNDLFRARAERAGINYIDVWDGFVDESGKFTTSGPDYEGQIRRLRSADGVFFTKYGARKLAHYVEREVRRYMSNRALPVAFPSGPLTPTPEDGKPAARPVVGPVVPLTVSTGNTDELLGAANSRPAYGDAIANDVLVKGESVHPQEGRADNFGWHPDAQKAAVEEAPSDAPAPSAVRKIEPGAKSVSKSDGPPRATQGAAAPKPKPAAKPAHTSSSR